MPSLDSLAAIVANPTVLSLIGVVGLVLAMRLRRLKWRHVELSFGRDDGDQPPNSRR